MKRLIIFVLFFVGELSGLCEFGIRTDARVARSLGFRVTSASVNINYFTINH